MNFCIPTEFGVYRALERKDLFIKPGWSIPGAQIYVNKQVNTSILHKNPRIYTYCAVFVCSKQYLCTRKI